MKNTLALKPNSWIVISYYTQRDIVTLLIVLKTRFQLKEDILISSISAVSVIAVINYKSSLSVMSTHIIWFGSWLVGETSAKPERIVPKYKTSFRFDGNLESNRNLNTFFNRNLQWVRTLCMLMRAGLSVTNCFLLPSTDRNTSGLLCLEEKSFSFLQLKFSNRCTTLMWTETKHSNESATSRQSKWNNTKHIL